MNNEQLLWICRWQIFFLEFECGALHCGMIVKKYLSFVIYHLSFFIKKTLDCFASLAMMSMKNDE